MKWTRWAVVLVIGILVLMIVIQVNTNAETSAKLNAVTSSEVTVSCAAVKLSDDAISKFLRREVATGTRAQDPASLAFLHDLDASLQGAEARCLKGQ